MTSVCTKIAYMCYFSTEGVKKKPMRKFWLQFGKSFHLITMWIHTVVLGQIYQCCHHSSELRSNTFLRASHVRRYCPAIPQNDDSIDRYILPRTTAFPQCTGSMDSRLVGKIQQFFEKKRLTTNYLDWFWWFIKDLWFLEVIM